VLIAPLTPLLIEACSSEVIRIAAPLLIEVSPDAAPAAPITALPGVVPRIRPAKVPSVVPPKGADRGAARCYPQCDPHHHNFHGPSSCPQCQSYQGYEPGRSPRCSGCGTQVGPSQDPTCPIGASNPQDGCYDALVELDRLVQKSIKAYESASTWGQFVAQCRDPKGGFHPEVKHLPHRAAHLLDTLPRSGATMGMKKEPWSRQRKDEALKRGLHQSAMLHTDLLCDEFVDMIHKGQSVILPARLVLDEKNL
jgi:hypothetical protein